MNEIERLETEIVDLKNAIDNIAIAINNLKDVDGLDEEYQQLNTILDNMEEEQRKLENEEANLKEEAFYQENEEQRKAEQMQQDYDYESSKL